MNAEVLAGLITFGVFGLCLLFVFVIGPKIAAYLYPEPIK